MCEYNLKTNFNGLEQYIVCDLSAIVCIICSVVNKHRVNQSKICTYHLVTILGTNVF